MQSTPVALWTSAGAVSGLRHGRTWRPVAALVLASLALAGAGRAEAERPYYLRNQNPFLQIFGLPAMEGGRLIAPGARERRFVLNMANHADRSDTASEEIVMDGESYYADVVLRFGVAENWEVGVDVPFVTHSSGTFDNVIEDWHDLLGLSNVERQGPSNHLRLLYRDGGVTEADLDSSGGGIGDVRLTGAYQLLGKSGAADRALAVRALLKLPTGDADRLRGSGAADFALSVDATDRATLHAQRIELFGQAGVLLLGDGDVLSERQEDAVPFAAGGLLWHWTDVIELHAQLSLQGSYFDSALNELGGGTSTLTIGGSLHFRRLGLKLGIGLNEDLVSDATPDFGMYLSLSSDLAGAPRASQ